MGVNLLYGKNAAGKTNALEAIYLFAAGKSFRTSNEKDFILKNSNGISKISMKYCENGDVFHEMSIKYFNKNKKLLKYEGVDIEKVSEFLGKFRAVLFTPDHMSLIKGIPDERRKFADLALSQIKPRYIYYLSEYYKTLLQKNSYLKNSKISGKIDFDLLSVFSEKLAESAAVITKQRAFFCEYLQNEADRFYKILSQEKESLSVKYLSNIKENFADTENIKQKYIEIYNKNAKNEAKLGYTMYGPHRDDILFFIGKNIDVSSYEENYEDKKIFEYAAKTFGSQGQQRSCVLAVKLAEGEIMKNLTGQYPVFLFDDVFSELDSDRQKFLTSLFSEKQVIITCCENYSFDISRISNMIKAENGCYFNES